MDAAGIGLTLDQFSVLLEDCVTFIEATCISMVGVYRIPGSMRVAKELHERYARGESVDLGKELSDPLTATTLLKVAISNLKEPLVPRKYYPLLRVINFSRAEFNSLPPRAIAAFYKFLPERNARILRAFLHHIQRVAAVPDNQMDLARLLMVLGPTCLVAYQEDPQEEMKANPGILEVLVWTIDEEGARPSAGRQ